MKTPHEILNEAITAVNPSHIICLFSGGYDSHIATKITHDALRGSGIPLLTYSIDTMLSADGWREYVQSCAAAEGWAHDIYINRRGFAQFVKLVSQHGCPYSRQGHSSVYRRLKERAIDDILRDHKTHRNDAVLFVSGIRRAESPARENAPEWSRRANTSAYFVAPIVHWSDEDCLKYRADNEMVNPFYETVGGSGDCQCNWGGFIDLDTLEAHAPKTHGRVLDIDALSRDLHGYGWGEKPNWELMRQIKAGQGVLFESAFDVEDIGFDISNLCAGCRRTKQELSEAEANAMLREW